MKPEFDVLGISIKSFGDGVRARLPRVRDARRAQAARARPTRRLGVRDRLRRTRRRGHRGARRTTWSRTTARSATTSSAASSRAPGSSGTGARSGARSACSPGCAGAKRSSCVLLDMCATALALGYAIGRIGCQVSGDGDYGIRSQPAVGDGLPARHRAHAPRRHGAADPDLRDPHDGARRLPAVAAARPRAPGCRVRPVPRAERARALAGRVHPPQQRDPRRPHRAAAGEPRADGRGARVARADDARPRPLAGCGQRRRADGSNAPRPATA